MTVGTGIFLSILVICATFVALCAMGLHQKNKEADRAIKKSFSKFLDAKVNSIKKE